MSQKVTIRDIARELRLSPATISLALNDAPGVNEETRRRVKEFAERARYQPNASARAISTGRSHLIAVVLCHRTTSSFEEVLRGIENLARRFNYDVIVNTIGETASPGTECIDRLIARHVDGVIGSHDLLSEKAISRLQEVGIPLVLLTPEPVDNLPCVTVDNRMGGRLAIDHLVALGHRRILFFGDSLIFSQLRFEGAWEAIEAHGGQMELIPVPDLEDINAAQESILEHFPARMGFTAAFCASDLLAVGVCRGAQEFGRRVPEDFSVIGFEDMRWAAIVRPPLTTIRHPQISQGETAMKMLVERIEGQPVANCLLLPSLVLRGSTAPAPL